MGPDEIVLLLFAALLVVFVTLGCVLLTSFWFRRWSVTMRSLIAAFGGAFAMFVPIVLMEEARGEVWSLITGLVAIFGVIGFPVALLATRKVERQHRDLKADLGSVFE